MFPFIISVIIWAGSLRTRRITSRKRSILDKRKRWKL